MLRARPAAAGRTGVGCARLPSACGRGRAQASRGERCSCPRRPARRQRAGLTMAASGEVCGESRSPLTPRQAGGLARAGAAVCELTTFSRAPRPPPGR